MSQCIWSSLQRKGNPEAAKSSGAALRGQRHRAPLYSFTALLCTPLRLPCCAAAAAAAGEEISQSSRGGQSEATAEREGSEGPDSFVVSTGWVWFSFPAPMVE